MKKLDLLWRKIVKKRKKPVLKPEDYWMNLGTKVIGNITKDEMLKSRQVSTYQGICRFVIQHSTRQVSDLGCNVGILGVLLRERNFNKQYIGIDANSHALNVARKNLSSYSGKSEFFETNLRHLDFPDKFFEMIVLKDVLEHLEDYKEVLSEVLRVTENYAVVANFIPWTDGDTLIKRESEGYFLNTYSRREVYKFINDENFSIVSKTATKEKNDRPNEVVLLKRKA